MLCAKCVYLHVELQITQNSEKFEKYKILRNYEKVLKHRRFCRKVFMMYVFLGFYVYFCRR